MTDRGNPKLARLKGAIESLSLGDVEQEIRAAKARLEKLDEERDSLSQRIEVASDELLFWEQMHVLRQQTNPVGLAARRNGASPRRWGPTRKAILEVMRQDGGELTWAPQDVYWALDDQDAGIPLRTVQNTMFRMARSGQLVKVGRTYLLAPAERRARSS